MSEDNQRQEDSLDQVITAFRDIKVPDSPGDGQVLARLAALQLDVPRPRRRFQYAAAAGIVLLLGGLVLTLMMMTSGVAQNDKATTINEAQLNGDETVMYRSQKDDAITTLWVDAKTHLPVRLEYELVRPSPDIALNKFVYTDFKWDPNIQDPEQLFSTTPPPGYTVEDRIGPATRPADRPTTAPGATGATTLDQESHDSVAALRSRERRVRNTAERVITAAVAVELALHEGTFNSGVIISPEGLVLSQYHVSHELEQSSGTPVGKSRQPGERAWIILHGGRRCEAELLGADRTYDLSLLRLIEPGPYPYTPLTDGKGANAGDWVLKLGHPGAYREGRDAVLRLGRVLCRTDDSLMANCRVVGGDSGGPLYDIDGRLIGLVRESALTYVLTPEEARIADRRHTGFPRVFAFTSGAAILERLDAMLNREISTLDTVIRRGLVNDLVNARRLPAGQWHGDAIDKAAYRQTIERVGSSVVAVMDGNKMLALGTVVTADGFVLTKASVLTATPQCRLHNGMVVVAKIISTDSAADIAMLKLDARDLRPIEWANAASLSPGVFAIAPRPEKCPLTVGVVSVALRDPPGPLPEVFEHDIVLRDEECGGPVVDLGGKALGITTASAAHGGIAVPADYLERLVRRWVSTR